MVLTHFDQFSWLGPITNLLVVPVVGMVVVPVGLAGILISPLSTVTAQLCWQGAAWCLKPLLWVIIKVADWPFSALTLIALNEWEIWGYYLLLLLVLTWKQHRAGWRAGALIMLFIFGMGTRSTGFINAMAAPP